MQRKSFKKLMVGGALLASLGLVAGCGEEGKKINEINPEEVADIFESAEYSVDEKNLEITLPEAVDSLVVGSLSSLGGSKYYLAADDDPEDPALDWDNELVEGAVIRFADTNAVRIVVLDNEGRNVAIWTVSFPVEEKSSSSVDADVSSSSKYEDEESSSSEETIDESSSSEDSAESSSSEEIIESSSSETVDESSSSVEPVDESSSSEIVASSSSEETVESSSSEEIVESSSSEEVVESSSSEDVVVSSSSEESVVESSSSEPVVSSSSEEPVVSSSSEMPVVESSSSTEEVVVSSSSEQMEPESSSSDEIESSSSSEEIIPSSSSVEPESSFSYLDEDKPQLPGSHFDSWDKNFWGSTSDAMAKDEWNTAIYLYSGANLKENGSSITLTSQVVYGSAVGQKLAGGFYFTGEYTGTTCDDIYNADGGYPGLESSNLTKKMNFGRPFTARPKSFDVTYAYDHVAGKDKSHPQMDLIYVMLVSADNKVIASGMITDTESVALTTKRVELQYGYAPKNLIDGTFAVQSGLTLGDGTEEVATIHVMFASSAHAHVAANGSSNWRGGKGSQLTIDEFKLNY